MKTADSPRESGRPKARARILAAARELVLAQGHEKVSLRAVAREAGFSPAGLYEYFDGRDALLDALADNAGLGLGRALRAATGRTASVRLVRLGLGYVRFARESSEDFLLLSGRMPQRHRSVGEAVPESPFALVLELCAQAIDARELRPPRKGTAETIAYGFWAAVHGMAMLQLTHLRGLEADFDGADRAILEALVAGWAP